MSKHGNRYAAEFRRQMVELVRAGRGPEELAREFEPVRSKYSCGFPMGETYQPAKPFTGAHLALGLR